MVFLGGEMRLCCEIVVINTENNKITNQLADIIIYTLEIIGRKRTSVQ